MQHNIETSLIIPVYNEEKYLDNLLMSLINSDYDKEKIEILIFDGGSTDNTLKILQKYTTNYPYIHLFSNPKRIQVEALNLALKKVSGKYIIRCDAHAEYPQNYISGLIDYLKNSKEKIGNVGFQAISVPGDESHQAEAVALAFKSPFGVGLSHRSKSFKEAISVDTLLFGAWKAEIFDDIGDFDTNFVRGQDYEHNKRLILKGYRVLLLPDTQFKYFMRTSLVKLAKMVYQYAYAKTQIIKKYKEKPSIRVVIPAIFVLGLFLSIFFPLIINLYLLYLVIDLLVVLKERKSLSTSFYLFIAFPLMHISHGIGFMRGLFDVFLLQKNTKRFDHTR